MSEPARAPRLDGARARRGDWRAWGRSLRAFHPDLTSTELHVAKHLALYADAEGRCFPSHDTLVEETRVPPRTLTQTIGRLKEAKVIGQEDGTGTGRSTAVYWLLPHVRSDEFLPPRVATESQNPANPATQGGSPRARGVGSSTEVPRRVSGQPDFSRFDVARRV